MKIQLPKQLVFVTVAGIGFATLLAQPSLAQTSDGINLQNYDSPNRTDPFAQGVEQNNFNMYELIHRANLGQLNPEYPNEQRQQLNDEIGAYRAKLQQRFPNQQQPRNPNSPVITPKSGN